MFAIALGEAFGGGLIALTVPVSEDTFANGDALTRVQGTASSLSVDSFSTSLLYFDLSEIPSGTVVIRAKLRMFLPAVRNQGVGLGVHLVTSQWSEAVASNRPKINPVPLGVLEPDKLVSKDYVTVDVTGAVQAWINGSTINEGFAVNPIFAVNTSPAAVTLASKEGASLGLPAMLDLELQSQTSAVGVQGPAGPTGLTGAQGPPGLTGATGPQGPQGPVGATGAQGPAGVNGKSVLSGSINPSVVVGTIGDFYLNTTSASLFGPKTGLGWGAAVPLLGVQGAQGPIGPTGATGPQGIQGGQGPQGLTGATGPRGLTGATGATGATGVQGPAGVDGKTVLNGSVDPSVVVGSVGDFYLNTTSASLFGPKTGLGWGAAVSLVGAQGAQGPIGATGATGPQGIQGAQGLQGVTGATGETGPQGLTGATGATGPQGSVGATGATGPQGPAGAAGKTILSGTVAPSSLDGTIGDFYYNTSSSSMYGPKTESGWGTATRLKGGTGATLQLRNMRWSKYPAYSVSGLYSSGYDRTVTHVGPLADEIMNTSSAIGGGTNAGRFWGYWDISSELPFGATITQIDINLTDTATYRAGVGDKYTGGNLMLAVTTVDSTWNETIVVSAESGRAFNAGVKTVTLSNLSIACDGSQTIRFKAHAEMFGDFPNYTSPGNGILKLNSVVITFNY